MKELEGTDWFTSFREGKEEALRHLFNELYPRIRYFAGDILNDDSYAEDIATGAFHKAWKSRHKFIRPRHLENFLFVVTRNECISYLESGQRKKANYKEWAYLVDESQHDNSPLDLERAQAQAIETIYAVLDTLPNGDVLRMIFLQKKSTKEIAEKLNTNVNNVYIMKSRALKALRAKLPKDLWLLFVLIFSEHW